PTGLSRLAGQADQGAEPGMTPGPENGRLRSLQLDHQPLERAGETERHLVGVVFEDRRAGVLADIERPIQGEPAGYVPLDLPLGHLRTVHQQSARPALAGPTAVVPTPAM